MTKKLITLLAALAIMAVPAFGQQVNYFQMEFQDMWGEAVTGLTSVNIQGAGTAVSSTIYYDRAKASSQTNPIVSGLGQGRIGFWLNAASYKVTATDGTNTLVVDNVTGSEARIPWWSSYMATQSGLSLTDAQGLVFGTDSDWTLQSASAGILTHTPIADNSAFNIGTSGASLNSDFNVYVGTALGLKLDAGDPSLTWDGGAVLLNDTSNFNVGINTGTSTGITSIGNSAGGGVAIDTTAGITVNADDSYALTVSAGTIGLAATGGDITIDGVDQSVIIRGTEEAGDAIYIHADGTAGGIDLTAGTGDIAMISTDDISMTVNNTTTDNIIITNTPGTGEDAINIDATAGGIDIDFATAKNMAVTGGQFIFTSNEDVAGAFTVTANTGTSETIVLTNTLGTGEAAFNIDATAGGIDIDFATAKNMAVTGGQFIFTSNEDVASAFSVITNTGSSETITLVNTQGTGTGAVTVTTTAAGDIDINSGDDITVDAADDMTTTVAGDYTLAVTGATVLPNDVLLKTTTAITDTQMDNLAGTQIELVAAVAGNTIEFVSAVFGLDWASTAWTEPSAPDDLVIRYTDGSGAIVSGLLDATGFATATADTYAYLGPVVANAAGAALASVAVTEAASTNQALVLDNTGSEWTNSGDSQVVVIVYYRLHTTAELGL